MAFPAKETKSLFLLELWAPRVRAPLAECAQRPLNPRAQGTFYFSSKQAQARYRQRGAPSLHRTNATAGSDHPCPSDRGLRVTHRSIRRRGLDRGPDRSRNKNGPATNRSVHSNPPTDSSPLVSRHSLRSSSRVPRLEFAVSACSRPIRSAAPRWWRSPEEVRADAVRSIFSPPVRVRSVRSLGAERFGRFPCEFDFQTGRRSALIWPWFLLFHPSLLLQAVAAACGARGSGRRTRWFPST
jgi:hypothetical protein